MSWSRIDTGFWRHPKFDGWKPAQKWAMGELIGYCAEYPTGGQIPTDPALLPRSITPAFLRLAEQSGWLDRADDNTLWIHDWPAYHPKDPTNAERQKRFRDNHKPPLPVTPPTVTNNDPSNRYGTVDTRAGAHAQNETKREELPVTQPVPRPDATPPQQPGNGTGQDMEPLGEIAKAFLAGLEEDNA